MNYCGYIALVGRPNVGKSTLLNKILKQKLSITSRKPQTTRHKIHGIETNGEYQYIFVDTPGIHQGIKKNINKLMNSAAISTLYDVDVIVFLVDGTHWRDEDEYVLSLIKQAKKPTILAINKVDKIKQKQEILPFIAQLEDKFTFKAIYPISAKTGVQVDALLEELKKYLPPGPFLFSEDDFTDRSIKFLCSEIIREKIFRLSGQELPYATAVEIESFKDEPKLTTIHALILLDKANHKPMIIGQKGTKLKEISKSARLDIEKLLGKKVFLKCWCKVKTGWVDNNRLLKQLGYDN